MKKTIIDLFEEAAGTHADRTLLLEKRHGHYQSTSYAETRQQAIEVGAGLAGLGVKPGERVAILGEGSNRWIIAELGLLYAGAVSVPLSIKLEEDNDLLFRMHHADVRTIFVSKFQLPKIRRLRDRLSGLQRIVVMGHTPLEAGEIAFETLKRVGRDHLAQHGDEFLAIGRNLRNEDYATITYTSGTTADPKGVVLTHRNYTANVEQALSRISIPPTFRTLIILPLDHCFAHVVGFYIMIACGASVATVETGRTPLETLRNIPINIRETQPHFLMTVPALAKNFRKGIEAAVRAKGALAQRFFRAGLCTAYAYNGDGYRPGRGWRMLLRPAVGFFDLVVFRSVRKAFGGRMQFFIGGGALLDAELQRFFYAIGIPMYQGYGLSEATPIISTNSPRKRMHRIGSSGTPVTPMAIRILDEAGRELPAGTKGEIVVRGENVMACYWKNPDATRETLRDGWLHTGDMGYLTDDGFLYVLGRFKSLLIAGDGEKYSPEGMEEALTGNSDLIDQVVIHNDQKPYTVAVVVPNAEALRGRIADEGLSPRDQLCAAARILAAEIDKYRTGGALAGAFPQRWLPVGLVIVEEPFTERNGMMNSTLKVVRSKVEERFRERIDYVYTPEGKELCNPRNLESLRRLIFS